MLVPSMVAPMPAHQKGDQASGQAERHEIMPTPCCMVDADLAAFVRIERLPAMSRRTRPASDQQRGSQCWRSHSGDPWGAYPSVRRCRTSLGTSRQQRGEADEQHDQHPRQPGRSQHQRNHGRTLPRDVVTGFDGPIADEQTPDCHQRPLTLTKGMTPSAKSR